jgi:protein associated with RNAse G/E
MMKNVSVHSTKYDGSLHYRYNTTLVHEEANALMLYMQPGTPIESYRGSMIAEYHNLQIYWSDRRYNLHVSWYAEWRPLNHYVNVATPAVWNDGTLNFIDLDLDVIWRSSTGEVILDDEDEFALHQVHFGYPSHLIEQSLRSSLEVRQLIAQRSYPFDGSLHAWRPNGSP